MRILSLDPGTEKGGLGLFKEEDSKIELLESRQVPLKGKNLSDRLAYYYAYLDEFLNKEPDVKVIALEKTFVAPPDKKTGEYKYDIQSPLKLSMARGVVYAIAGKYNITVYEYMPGDVKQTITGNYHANKKMMIRQINKTYNKEFEEDEADAIGIGITHFLKRKT